MRKIVVLTGAGISAESGINTFRDSDGLWEGHDIMEVASPEGWAKNPELVLDFYNQRRKQAQIVLPNEAHYSLVELEKKFETTIITQNVDNLHERAGSKNIVHLHGQLFQSRSTKNSELVYQMKDWKLDIGDTCELGSQLRPNIVWFGEQVPLIEKAIDIVSECNFLIIIGTSMVVYPAASLVNYTSISTQIYCINPNITDLNQKNNVINIQKKATIGVPELVKSLLNL